jgi:S1-C subfamily serine protease
MKTWHPLVPAAVLLAGSISQTAVHAQSLAELSRKAAEQRESARSTPSKKYTDADVKAKEAIIPAASGTEPSSAPLPPVPITESSRVAIIKAVTPAVVTIDTSVSSGSGFLVAPGLVLTNKHVISGGGSIRVRFADGSATDAYLSATALDADLALLRISAAAPSTPTVRLGNVRDVHVGQDVLAIGSALGVLRSTVTRGIVSAVRTVNGLTYLQTDAAINPGNSGGPLIVGDGVVVGITTLKMSSAESLGFAIGIDHAKALMQGQTSVAFNRARTPATSDGGLEATLQPPTKSDTDLMRERGREQFETTVRTLAELADDIDAQWRRYRAGCAGQSTYAAVYGRDWFGIWSNAVVIYSGSLPECRSLWSDIVSLADRVRVGMQRAEENGRRADVYPGTRRDIRKQYGMDWPGWDR